MKDWLPDKWIRRPGGVPKNLARLALNALTAIKATITGRFMDTDIVVIPHRMASQLRVLDVVISKPL
jgi:hypothetical protein